MAPAALEPLGRWAAELLRLPEVVFAEPGRAWLGLPLLLALLLAPLLRRGAKARALPALALRALALAALLALLLEPRVEERETREGRLVVLADVSPSVGEPGRARAAAYLDGAPAPFDLVTFDETPRLHGEGVRLREVEPEGRMATDIARALRFADARTGDEPLRVVLLSDGRATRPGAEQAAVRLRTGRAELFAFAVPEEGGAGGAEIQALGLEAPPRGERGPAFPLRARVRASAPCRARLSLFVNGQLARATDADLREGPNEILLDDVTLPPGRHEVQVLLDGDLSPADNLAGTEVEVEGTPRVLCLAASARPSLVAKALETQGIAVDVAPAGEARDLMGYDAVVILPDAPVPELEARAAALAEFARGGGGLLAIGGSEGPGLARLADSPFAYLLPLKVAARPPAAPPPPTAKPEKKPKIEIVEEEQEAFPITLCLVIDRSGSMEESFKLRQAKAAAIAAAQSLTKSDFVSILAFADAAEVLLPPSPARDDRTVEAAVRSLASGGHTAMYQALVLSYEVMRREATPIRHVILITDGISTDDGKWRDLLAAMTAEGVTVSTVGIGLDVDAQKLARLAQWGAGKFWLAQPHEIPQVVTQDTLRVVKGRDTRGEDAERAPPTEEPPEPPPETPPPPEPPPPPRPRLPIVAVAGVPRDMLKGIEDDDLPRVAAPEEGEPRFASWVAARAGADGPPLLAYFRFGLGTSAALVVDPEAPAETELRAHKELPRMLAQLARSVLPDARGEPFVLIHDTRNGALALRVLGEDGRPRTDVRVEATVDGAPLALVRRAGGYEAPLPPRERAAAVSVRVAEGGRTLRRDFIAPPSGHAELQQTGPDRAALLRLVGEPARLDAPAADALRRPRAAHARLRPLPLPFLLLAAILLPVDAWLRRRVRSASR
jgi:Mg-chelatase subunit ChlD